MAKTNKKRRETPTQKANREAYNKELRRIRKFISRAEKRGYSFDYTIPTRPKRITKTSVERLRKVTPDILYQHSTYVPPEYKNISNAPAPISGTEARKAERKRAAQRAAETRRLTPEQRKIRDSEKQKRRREVTLPREEDIILANVEQMISEFDPSPRWTEWFKQVKQNDVNTLQNILNGAIKQYGRTEVARRLAAHSGEVIALVNEIMYDSGGGLRGGLDNTRNVTSRNMVAFSNIVNARMATREEAKALYDETNDYLEEDFDVDSLEER